MYLKLDKRLKKTKENKFNDKGTYKTYESMFEKDIKERILRKLIIVFILLLETIGITIAWFHFSDCTLLNWSVTILNIGISIYVTYLEFGTYTNPRIFICNDNDKIEYVCGGENYKRNHIFDSQLSGLKNREVYELYSVFEIFKIENNYYSNSFNKLDFLNIFSIILCVLSFAGLTINTIFKFFTNIDEIFYGLGFIQIFLMYLLIYGGVYFRNKTLKENKLLISNLENTLKLKVFNK